MNRVTWAGADEMSEAKPVWQTAHLRMVEHDGTQIRAEDAVFIKLYCRFRSMLADLQGAPLSVFLCIALHMDRDDRAYPGLRLIAKETGYAVNTVRSAIERLVARGFVDIIERRPGHVTGYAVRGWATTKAKRTVSTTDTPTATVSVSPPTVSNLLPTVSISAPTVSAPHTDFAQVEEVEKKSEVEQGLRPDPPSLKVRERVEETDAKIEEYYAAYQKGMSTDADEIAPLLDSVRKKIRPILLDAMAKGITALAVQNVVALTVSNPKWRPFNAATDLANAVNTLGPWRARGRPDRW